MADMFHQETRRRIMRTVRTAQTGPENLLAQALDALALWYHRNDAELVGKPDFAFPGARLAVFVDGDFWHGRDWFESHASPSTNAEFWIAKFERNRQRDHAVDIELRRLGWSVLRLWGSDVQRDPATAARLVRRRLRRLARAGRHYPSPDK